MSLLAARKISAI